MTDLKAKLDALIADARGCENRAQVLLANFVVKHSGQLIVAPVWRPDDGADVCEMCGQLTIGGRTYARASLAITFLYTEGILTGTERDKARARIAALKGRIPTPPKGE